MRRNVLIVPILLFAIGLLPDNAAAQTVGVKLGFVSSGLRGDDGDPDTDYSRRRDWSGGLYARLAAGPVVLQPEVLYSRRGANASNAMAPDSELRFRLDYLEFPVLLRLGGGSTSIYVGGYGALKINAKAESRPLEGDWGAVDISSSVESFDYGIVAGLAMDFGKFGLDARYVLGMRNIFTSPVPELAPPDLKHSALAVYSTLQF
jgi:hypothetical protein